jgi:hypothetical protein
MAASRPGLHPVRQLQHDTQLEDWIGPGLQARVPQRGEPLLVPHGSGVVRRRHRLPGRFDWSPDHNRRRTARMAKTPIP